MWTTLVTTLVTTLEDVPNTCKDLRDWRAAAEPLDHTHFHLVCQLLLSPNWAIFHETMNPKWNSQVCFITTKGSPALPRHRCSPLLAAQACLQPPASSVNGWMFPTAEFVWKKNGDGLRCLPNKVIIDGIFQYISHLELRLRISQLRHGDLVALQNTMGSLPGFQNANLSLVDFSKNCTRQCQRAILHWEHAHLQSSSFESNCCWCCSDMLWLCLITTLSAMGPIFSYGYCRHL